MKIMYLNILKKDIRRKKTMNVIVLIFVLISSMFVSSSVNNIVTVMSGIDYYLDKAGVADYMIFDIHEEEAKRTEEILNSCEFVSDIGAEDCLYAPNTIFRLNGEKVKGIDNDFILTSADRAKINFFNENDDKITSVKPGEAYLAAGLMEQLDLKNGDEFEIYCDNESLKLKIAGACKDVLFSSQLMGKKRVILSEEDYAAISGMECLIPGKIFNVTTRDIKALEKVIADADNNIDFNCDRALIKMTYVLDILVAAILLVISVCLILIAFIVLKFTISFTLSEEFREIGIMKAIGIKTRNIRSLYLVKYLGISAAGAFVGFWAGIPFGSMMMSSISKKMVLGNSGGILVNIFSSAGVMAVVLLFCWFCTRKIKKFTPIDAIRTGETGERFKKKRGLRLRNSKGKTGVFMALNDILSSPGRYITIVLAFALCLTIVNYLNTTANTLCSDELATTFGVTRSDVYYSNPSEALKFMVPGGRDMLMDRFDEYKKELSDNGMPASAHVEVQARLNIEVNGETGKILCQQGVGDVTASEYTYTDGSAPQNRNEIAITKKSAEKLGVGIGDTLTFKMPYGDVECMITGYFESMNSLGEGARLYDDFELDFGLINGFFEYQFDFNDDPSAEQITERIDRLKDLWDTDKLMTAGEFAAQRTSIGGAIASVEMLVLILTFIIIGMIAVLLERSFIAKEQSEIALLKAIGFKHNHIIITHIWRFIIVGAVSCLIAMAIAIPTTSLIDRPIFGMMGATNIDYKVDPLKIFALYPVLTMIVTVLCVFFTALYTKKIKSSDISNIE